MYTHYLLGALKIYNPFKKYITYVQICQFYMCVTHATVTALGYAETIYPRMLAVLQLSYHVTMIYLFSAFLRNSKNYAKDGTAKKHA